MKITELKQMGRAEIGMRGLGLKGAIREIFAEVMQLPEELESYSSDEGCPRKTAAESKKSARVKS